MSTFPRISIPGVAVRPAGFTRHVAYLAGADFRWSQRRVPLADDGRGRTVCYFGRSNAFALFKHNQRVALEPSPVRAALFLLGSPPRKQATP